MSDPQLPCHSLLVIKVWGTQKCLGDGMTNLLYVRLLKPVKEKQQSEMKQHSTKPHQMLSEVSEKKVLLCLKIEYYLLLNFIFIQNLTVPFSSFSFKNENVALKILLPFCKWLL